MMKLPPLLPSILVVLTSLIFGYCSSSTLTANAEIIRTIDGDTIAFKTNEEVKIRLACIDAPELKQPRGVSSKLALQQLIESSEVIGLQTITTDRYNRKISILWLHGSNTTAQAELVKSGQVFIYHQYKKDCPIYDDLVPLEEQAKSKRLGVWQNPTPDYPWTFRKNK